MKQSFNIPKIENNTKEKHKQFLEKFGYLADKVEADHQLSVEKMVAKVTRILTCFCDNEIIDEVVVANKTVYKRIIISKKGYNNHMAIWIDGKNIVIQKISIFNSSNVLARDDDAKTIFDADADDFDWESFSNDLLDYTHEIIYSKTNIIRTKMDNIFDNDKK